MTPLAPCFLFSRLMFPVFRSVHRPRADQWPGLRLRGRGQLDRDLHLRPGLCAGGPGAAQVPGRGLVRPLAPRLYRSVALIILIPCHILMVSSDQSDLCTRSSLYHPDVKRTGVTIISEPGYRSHAAPSRRKWAPHISCLRGVKWIVQFLFVLSTMHIFLCYNNHYRHVGHRQTTVLSKLSSTHHHVSSRQQIGNMYYLSHLIIILSTIRLNFSLLL